MYWTKFTKLCDVILNNAIYGLCTLYNDSSVISKIKLLSCYQKIVILAQLVLKRILEYSLGAQKKFKILKVTIRLSLTVFI